MDGSLVCFVACLEGLLLRLRGGCRADQWFGSRLLSVVPHTLLIDGICHLRGAAEEVEVSSRCLSCTTTSTASKGVIVEIIISFIQLVSQTIVCIFEIEAGNEN